MKILLRLFGLLAVSSAVTAHAATSYTDFYCNISLGSQMNGGSSTNATASYTSTSGNWDGTSLFIPTDSSTPATTLTNQYASVYNDGATTPVYCALVVAVTNASNGGITLSTTKKFGTAPTSNATTRSIKIGGCWKGPNGADSWPVNSITPAATDAAGDPVWVTLFNSATYALSQTLTNSVLGPLFFSGATLTARDGGKCSIDVTNTGAGINVINIGSTAQNTDLYDMILSNSGATTGTTTTGIIVNAAKCILTRLVAHDVRADGFNFQAAVTLRKWEAYLCNKANAAGKGGVNCASGPGTVLQWGIAHDNAGSNASGIIANAVTTIERCILDTNGKDGITISTTNSVYISQCAFYNNGAAGIDLTGSAATGVTIENSLFTKNTTFGITSSGSSSRNGQIINCIFGAGTQANGSGDIASNTGGILISGSVSLASDVSPWVDAPNGNFAPNSTVVFGAGIVTWTETQGGYGATPTVSYSDVGAAQHLNLPAAHAYPFAQ